MQESDDGCSMSETYLGLIASLHNLNNMDINGLSQPGFDLTLQEEE